MGDACPLAAQRDGTSESGTSSETDPRAWTWSAGVGTAGTTLAAGGADTTRCQGINVPGGRCTPLARSAVHFLRPADTLPEIKAALGRTIVISSHDAKGTTRNTK